MHKDKIIKLLKLSSSNNDNEALLAIKTANQILKKNNATWDDLFKLEENIIYNHGDFHKKDFYEQECGYSGCTYKMKFGKYKNTFLDDLVKDDPNYVLWLIKQDWCSEWLKDKFEEMLDDLC